MIAGPVRRIGIIGAGVAGLAAAKTLLAEGYDCIVFERADRLGGVWAQGYVDFGVQVQKELYEFPDWPLPAETPDFTPGPIFQAYLESYCDHFAIRPHLRLATNVLSVDRQEGDGTGWEVRVDSAGQTATETFDLVVVATGLYSQTPNIPDYPGRESFGGEILHAYDIDTRAPLQGRRVAVIGYGKSATDICGEAAEVRTPIWYFATRTGRCRASLPGCCPSSGACCIA